MVVVRVYTVIGGLLVLVFFAPTITLLLNWVNGLRNELSDPDAYRIEIDGECFRN